MKTNKGETMKTFGHCGCCIAEQERAIRKQREGVEYLKYIDSLPEGEQKDKLIDRAYKNAQGRIAERHRRLRRRGTTPSGRYRG